ncbi:MAG: hypothetical protein RBT36_01595 [Desulfobulbus sp.]|jgi:hypothetical protein|nr:hypothetical protein [Desulfobulbus sp.]
MDLINEISIIAAINNPSVAEQNLLRSPLLRVEEVQFIPAEGFTTAPLAYNYARMRAGGQLLVFVHQDVYLPLGWEYLLLDTVTELDKKGTLWGVLGVVGVGVFGGVRGRVWSTGLAREVGAPVNRPEGAVSLDELLLVIRKNSGLTFDERLPGWHLYGTDIVQEALRRDLGAYIIHAPVIHNSLPVARFDHGFTDCYNYLRQKWSSQLPVQTCCIKVTRTGWPLMKRQIRQMLRTTDRQTSDRLPDPAAKARALGYE